MKNSLFPERVANAGAVNLPDTGLNAISRRWARIYFLALLGLLLAVHPHAAAAENVIFTPDQDSFRIADASGATSILFAPGDADVVRITAGLFADDVNRVTGQKPSLLTTPPASGTVILVGHARWESVDSRFGRAEEAGHERPRRPVGNFPAFHREESVSGRGQRAGDRGR